MSNQTEEKEGTGFIGATAAGVVGAGAGKLMADRQANNLIDAALKGEDEIFKTGKKADFATKLKEVAGKPAGEGQAQSFVEKLNKAKADLAITGEEALKGDAKKAAKTAQKEALSGIKAGMKEAKMPVWKNMTAGQIGKVALVAIPATIATKIALDGMFGRKHTSQVEASRANAQVEAGRA